MVLRNIMIQLQECKHMVLNIGKMDITLSDMFICISNQFFFRICYLWSNGKMLKTQTKGASLAAFTGPWTSVVFVKQESSAIHSEEKSTLFIRLYFLHS